MNAKTHQPSYDRELRLRLRIDKLIDERDAQRRRADELELDLVQCRKTSRQHYTNLRHARATIKRLEGKGA